MNITTINPTDGTIINSYPVMNDRELNHRITANANVYPQWRSTSIKERSNLMLKAADLLIRHKEDYAKLISTEMGKPITAARAEIEKCVTNCQYFANQAEIFLKPQFIATELKKSYISYTPLGSIFGIMPWNFPFWQVFRFAAPTLMAGNTVLLKHAPIVTGCNLAIEKLFIEAGFPKHVFDSLIITEEQASEVIAHPSVKGVSLTGSQRAGRAVAAQAGAHLKKTVLELGGNDPYVILADADLDHAATICARSRLANSGQVCIAAKRLIVVEKVKVKFQQLVLEKISHYLMGNPLDETTQLGPLAREDLRQHLQQQVEASIQQGALLLCGGEIPQGPGFYYPITVLDKVKKGMAAYDEELFGPVISFVSAKDTEEAIALANDSPFGLSAAIFTQNESLGQAIAEQRIEAGCCYVNQLVSSDPRLPFGGIKASGYGRELSAVGMHEFMNIKTIGIN